MARLVETFTFRTMKLSISSYHYDFENGQGRSKYIWPYFCCGHPLYKLLERRVFEKQIFTQVMVSPPVQPACKIWKHTVRYCPSVQVISHLCISYIRHSQVLLCTLSHSKITNMKIGWFSGLLINCPFLADVFLSFDSLL